ncbi:MAG TPA: dethiobiotin synthase [Verrucomicrobiae bacterium]|nr:dethiobiotin synthase [Verrucomicrobiae bacterium]
MNCGLFVTGTDTGVGKTYVTALILAELRRRGVNAAAFKPISCGAGGRNDAKIYAGIMNDEVPLDAINPIYLRHPLAPSVAARLERRRLDLRPIFSSYRSLISVHQIVLVEGAGGLLVPIRKGYYVADLAKAMDLPLIIVARLGLGTINHSLLTIQEARAHGLKIAGIVLNDTVGGHRGLAEKTNIETVPSLCRVPLLGIVAHGKDGAAAAARRICRRLFRASRYPRGRNSCRNSTGS